MINWDEVKTALQVAREGTVSGAANQLGVHHATVIRHVDSLEERLGVKLFQRHSRGYTPTEAGEELMRVGQITEDQFTALEGKIKGRGDEVSGEIVITALPSIAHDIVPIIAKFQMKYPDASIRLLTSERIFRLEYGEAHVAIRGGDAPQEPDNVVQKFHDYTLGLYASRDYVKRLGVPETQEDFVNHRFVGREGAPAKVSFFRWFNENVPASSVVLRTSDDHGLMQAIQAGIGIGFVPSHQGDLDPELVRIWSPENDWTARLWIVTHVDLHRTAKVQAIVKALKEGIQSDKD